jgi:hypothetical protein
MIRPTPPVAARFAEVVDVLTVQAPPVCDTVYDWLPIEIVPVRLDSPVFALALKSTIVLPDPLGVVTVSHGADDSAAHVQPGSVVNATHPVPPTFGTVPDVDDSEKVHEGGACSTAKVWPATEISPLRAEVPACAATVKVTVPLDVPVSPPVIVIHGSSVKALHPQPLSVVTVKEPRPPSAVAEWLAGDSE